MVVVLSGGDEGHNGAVTLVFVTASTPPSPVTGKLPRKSTVLFKFSSKIQKRLTFFLDRDPLFSFGWIP